MTLVSAESLSKIYQVGDVAVTVIDNVAFTIDPGSFVSFVGPSGSGKSTLLKMIGCLDRPSEGLLEVMGADVSSLGRREAADFRSDNISIVFQDFNLIPVLTAYENVAYPLMMVQNWSSVKRRARVMELLEAVDMTKQANKRPFRTTLTQKNHTTFSRLGLSIK